MKRALQPVSQLPTAFGRESSTRGRISWDIAGRANRIRIARSAAESFFILESPLENIRFWPRSSGQRQRRDTDLLRLDPAEEGAGDVVVVRLNEDGHEVVADRGQSEIVSYEEAVLENLCDDCFHIERAIREPNLAAPVGGIGCGLGGRWMTENQPAISWQPRVGIVEPEIVVRHANRSIRRHGDGGKEGLPVRRWDVERGPVNSDRNGPS